jgi:hypothetical protein
MTDHSFDAEDLRDELRKLGSNLVAALRIARNGSGLEVSYEEIMGGLADLAGILERESGQPGASAAAQRQEIERQYLQGPGTREEEVKRFEAELSSAIRAANASLQEVNSRWTAGKDPAGEGRMPAPAPRQEGHQEVHPDDVNSPPGETGHEEVHPDDVESGNTSVDLGK